MARAGLESHSAATTTPHDGTSPARARARPAAAAPLTHSAQAAQQSQGIQTLLEAEKEAAKIVQQARQCTLA